MLIDFRAQILPGMDGLCPSHLTAIRRLLLAQQAGIDVLVAAPMLDLDQMPAALFLKRRDAAAEHLELLLQEGMPRVVIGAEVLWHPALEREALSALCTALTMASLITSAASAPTTSWSASTSPTETA